MAPLRALSASAAARVMKKGPSTLASITRRHSAVVVSITEPLPSTPAAFTSPSRPLNRSTAAFTHAAHAASSRTSPVTASASPPAAAISRTTSSSRSRRLPASTTFAPSAPSARAVARPMPLLAPVTSIVLPSNRFCSAMPPSRCVNEFASDAA